MPWLMFGTVELHSLVQLHLGAVPASVLCVVLGAVASSESFVRKMDELNAGVMFLSQLLYSWAPYGLLISDCGTCHLPVEQ